MNSYLVDEHKKDPTLDFESECFARGVPMVIGMDEVGRGALAGPVAVGVQVVHYGMNEFPSGLRDSKLLSEKKRELLAPQIAAWGSGAVGYTHAHEIEAQGIVWALGEAGFRALTQLHESGVNIAGAAILVDGSQDWLTPALRRHATEIGAASPPKMRVDQAEVRTLIGADRRVAAVAAASVRAKVARDQMMRDAHESEPYYGWASNKGYGAKAHYTGIATHGLSALHRNSWVRLKPHRD